MGAECLGLRNYDLACSDLWRRVGLRNLLDECRVAREFTTNMIRCQAEFHFNQLPYNRPRTRENAPP